jgi:hypothetical protein
MPTPKNITKKATNTAAAQGLNVRGATKAPAATKTVSKVAKAAPAPKVAPTKAVKVVKKAVPTAVKVQPSDKPMWTQDTDRAGAHRAIVRHVGDTLPIKGNQSYWAEANVDIRRFNRVIVAKGDWLLAFDVLVDNVPTTIYFAADGTEALRVKTDDDAKIDRFTYFD